jgi:hypothetical protein
MPASRKPQPKACEKIGLAPAPDLNQDSYSGIPTGISHAPGWQMLVHA